MTQALVNCSEGSVDSFSFRECSVWRTTGWAVAGAAVMYSSYVRANVVSARRRV